MNVLFNREARNVYGVKKVNNQRLLLTKSNITGSSPNYRLCKCPLPSESVGASFALPRETSLERMAGARGRFLQNFFVHAENS